MKSVIAAAILLVLTVGFCLFSSARTARMLTELYDMAQALPAEIDFDSADNENTGTRIDAITERWSSVFPYFSYVCGYAVLNRADEAVWNLYAAFGAQDAGAAASARYQLLDALRRMRELEGISLSSVF